MKHRGRIEWFGLMYCMITPRKALERHRFYMAVEAVRRAMMKTSLVKPEPFTPLNLTTT